MKIMDLMTNSLDDLSFIKRKEIFSYQNEYRYLIVDELEERKNIRFEIGDLKDLATINSPFIVVGAVIMSLVILVTRVGVPSISSSL